MKRLTLILALLATPAFAGTAFFQYEINSNGMTKICMYDYLGSPYALTVSSVAICPLSIQVP